MGKFARTYNGHRGLDIDVPTFKWTEENFPVLAASEGIVISTDFSHPDRNLVKNLHDRNPPKMNPVEVRHNNGYISMYGRLKQDTGYVKVGDNVTREQKLGVVASSGNSTWPYLHFELRDCNNKVIYSSREKLWQNFPAYQANLNIMDVVIRSGRPPKDATRFIIDGKPNQLRHLAGSEVTIATILAGGKPEDKLEVVIKASGRIYKYFKKTFENHHRKSWWYWYLTLPDNYSGGVSIYGLIKDTKYL